MFGKTKNTINQKKKKKIQIPNVGTYCINVHRWF